MTEKKYKVVGLCPIRGADRQYVSPGGVVTLDPEDTTSGATNVKALLDGGHLEEIKSGGGSTKDDKGK